MIHGHLYRLGLRLPPKIIFTHKLKMILYLELRALIILSPMLFPGSMTHPTEVVSALTKHGVTIDEY